jgi:hypothetical protein
MIKNIRDGNKVLELAKRYKESQELGKKARNNGHKEVKKVDRRWLNALVKRAIVHALTPKLREMKVDRVKVVYRENFGDVANNTLKSRFHLGRRVW